MRDKMKNIFLEGKQMISDHMSEIGIVSISAILSFICSYFLDLALNHYEQFIAVISVTFLDGIFGIIAGSKREGFKTFKAIKVLRTMVVWIVITATLLTVERGFPVAAWLSETILLPYLIFQIISTLKNASMSGFINSKTLNEILDRIDRHKGKREE